MFLIPRRAGVGVERIEMEPPIPYGGFAVSALGDLALTENGAIVAEYSRGIITPPILIRMEWSAAEGRALFAPSYAAPAEAGRSRQSIGVRVWELPDLVAGPAEAPPGTPAIYVLSFMVYTVYFAVSPANGDGSDAARRRAAVDWITDERRRAEMLLPARRLAPKG